MSVRYVELDKEEMNQLEENGQVEINYKGNKYQVREEYIDIYSKDYQVRELGKTTEEEKKQYVRAIFYEV